MCTSERITKHVLIINLFTSFSCARGALSRLGFLFDLPLSPDLRTAKGQAALELRAGQQMWPVELPTQLRHSSFAALWRNSTP